MKMIKDILFIIIVCLPVLGLSQVFTPYVGMVSIEEIPPPRAGFLKQIIDTSYLIEFNSGVVSGNIIDPKYMIVNEEIHIRDYKKYLQGLEVIQFNRWEDTIIRKINFRPPRSLEYLEFSTWQYEFKMNRLKVALNLKGFYSEYRYDKIKLNWFAKCRNLQELTVFSKTVDAKGLNNLLNLKFIQIFSNQIINWEWENLKADTIDILDFEPSANLPPTFFKNIGQIKFVHDFYLNSKSIDTLTMILFSLIDTNKIRTFRISIEKNEPLTSNEIKAIQLLLRCKLRTYSKDEIYIRFNKKNITQLVDSMRYYFHDLNLYFENDLNGIYIKRIRENQTKPEHYLPG
jgi:hypothetical protein